MRTFVPFLLAILPAPKNPTTPNKTKKNAHPPKQAKFAENGLDVIKLSDKTFLRTLENGVRFGKWVLLENVGEALDASLETLLLQQKFRQGGQEMIKIGDSVIPWNDSFNFFITTKLPNPHYPPEVCVKVSPPNFAITFSGLEDQLLGVTVSPPPPIFSSSSCFGVSVWMSELAVAVYLD